MTLKQMAREYRANNALLEQQLKQLERAQRREARTEVRYHLRRRTLQLQAMLDEGRRTARLLEQYYTVDKPSHTLH